eukprot:COSAG06_NODE_5589_length_3379_cov_115.159451_3_plen_72_part_00
MLCCCFGAVAGTVGHSAAAAVARGGEVEALRHGVAGLTCHEPQEVGGCRERDGDDNGWLGFENWTALGAYY